MTGLKKNISNKVNHHLRLKGLCKTRGSARVKATEALLSNFQSVVECLEEESENSETNSKSLFRARCLIKSLNWVLFLNLIWWNKIPQIIDVVSRLLQSKSNDLFLVVQSFQSVVDKLSVLRTRDQYNAFVTEAKTVRSNVDIFTDVLGPAEFPKKTKKMPLQIDENTGGISLSQEDKHRTIYFETLDNMIGELNERMNGFSKVLDLFYFLNPDELKKLNIEDMSYLSSAFIEKMEIIVWRREYLRAIRRYREQGRPIYYVDETWVYAGEVPNKVPKTDSSLTVCYASSQKKNTQDYHDEMNGKCFRYWLESVLPRLKDNAVIVIDNAPYHSVKRDKYPNTNSKKADIISWLESKGHIVDPSMVIRELIPIVNTLKPIYNKYVIDEMVKTYNKDTLRLPPYHRELNPIELAWSSVKNHVRMNNSTFELSDVYRLIIEGIHRVNSDMWKNFIKHVIGEEDKLWNMDFVVDELMAKRVPCVLNVAPGDSDSDNDVRPLSDD
ncbi:hypothetical protein QTP88_027855 [Uroleucon formosanum]